MEPNNDQNRISYEESKKTSAEISSEDFALIVEIINKRIQNIMFQGEDLLLETYIHEITDEIQQFGRFLQHKYKQENAILIYLESMIKYSKIYNYQISPKIIKLKEEMENDQNKR